MSKYVYFFGNGKADGNASMKDLLGGKGANLAEMTNLGIPVPPGFTISTEVCTYFYQHGKKLPEGLMDEVKSAISRVEEIMGSKFGDPANPLLFSVRSGARVSMPGMMDTVLNLGLNSETLKGLAEKSGSERFAYDSYRRFIQMYGDVVLGVDSHALEAILEEKKREVGAAADTDLKAEHLADLCEKLKAAVERESGEPFPEDPWKQLERAIMAVFLSWNTPRAITYRKLNKIPEEWGTAVNVQSMVFGNMGDDCATGVAFTRDAATGEKIFFGEYLVNAQGEDVVAGIRTPQPINEASRRHPDQVTLESIMPDVYKQLEEIRDKLERHYKDMQDIEFTIQNGKLWMLQTRTGKRTARAALKIAVDMVKEGLIDEKTAVMRVQPDQLDQLLHPTIDPKAEKTLLAKGLPASPGAVSGQVVFSADDAQRWKEEGKKVILVRIETSPEDIHGMNAAEGILTSRGGMTSHAAVVARGMGKCCVVGCGELDVDYNAKEFKARGKTVKEGDVITLDGSTGEVLLGEVPTVEAKLDEDFHAFMEWVDKFRRLKVRTNADTPHDSKVARSFGAEGIGLCRTEHMFFDADRIDIVRKMILAEDEKGRTEAASQLEPIQQKDFEGIFEAMDGLPVTIRLLDPPLHEFLPHTDPEIREIASRLNMDADALKRRVGSLKEFNPMLGHRGCRLGITFPEIYRMQVRAIMQAAIEVKKRGIDVYPEIMIPLVADVAELRELRRETTAICDELLKQSGADISYTVGTMIELPRAALTADKVAEEADFFSFGTNDLTQTTFGLSRDDSGKFLPTYVSKGIFPVDPFVSLDRDGVGALVKMGVEKGRSTKQGLKVGICGEHGGDPASVEFCHKIGLDYVSCSPYRVPIARLAAAQAALSDEG